MSNWTEYVKQYSIEHGIPYGAALKKAAPSYHKLYGGIVLGGKKRKSMLTKRKSTKQMKSPMIKHSMMDGRIKKKKMHKGGKINENRAYEVGQDLYDVLGGGKGALAALLSGLDARVNIK